MAQQTHNRSKALGVDLTLYHLLQGTVIIRAYWKLIETWIQLGCVCN